MAITQYFSNEQEKLDFLNNAKIDTDSVIKIGSTSYDVKEKWFNMASKFFEIDTENTPIDDNENEELISLLKAGLFGYINEINSHEVKNAIYHRNVLYDELFLNTASIPMSIYNFAKLYNVPIQMATPANFKVDLVVRKEDILKLPTKEIISTKTIDKEKSLKTYEATISKKQDFTIGNFKYSLPYDVSIILKQYPVTKDGKELIDYKISANYNIDNNLFKFSSILDNNVKVTKNISNGIDYLFFSLDLYQIDRVEKEFNITSNDIAENIYLDSSYEGQLAGFNVFYEYMGERIPMETYFNNTFTPDTDNPFCYYNFKEENKLEISFSNIANSFRPKANSRVIIETLTTRGEQGNFNYNDTLNVSLESGVSTFEKIPVTVLPKGNSVNGRNKPTVNSEKRRIINKAITRDNIITDFDIKNYFNEVNDSNNINNSFINFVKKRNDLYTRMYNAFLLLRDSDNKVMPTNTAPYLDFPKDYFIGNTSLGNEEDGYVIPENSLFKYDHEEKEYIHIPDGLDDKDEKEKFEKDKDSLYYVNPFLIKINKYPFLSSNYYKLHVNDLFSTEYKYINDLIPSNITTTDLYVEKLNDFKNTLESDTFKFSVEIGMDTSLQEMKDLLSVRAVLLSQETGEKYGYFELKPEENIESENNIIDDSDSSVDKSSLYTGMISTNRSFHEGKLAITDSLYDSKGIVQDNVFIDEKFVVKIGIMYKDEDMRYFNELDYSDEMNFFKDAFPNHEDNEINDYTLACSMETFEGVSIYKDMSNVMNSTISMDDSKCRVELIPMFSLGYFMNNYEEVYKVLDGYKGILEDAIPRLQNNTSIDMKLYNTKGPSNNYYLDTKLNDDNVENKYISRTDILLDLNITLYAPINDFLDKEIKRYISDFIEACNENGIIPISNLIRLLEQNFDIIKYIVFNGISGKYAEKVDNHYQKLLNTNLGYNDLNKQEIIEYVPEYINIKKNLRENKVEIENEDNSTGTTVIDLGLTYDDVVNVTYSVS
ncbi:hypothetical protein CPT_Machias_182 [Staphylococcus phage Machias]|nr:hypothetical protein CPT_Machias_182 [Staphylococcus phage Machias]